MNDLKVFLQKRPLYNVNVLNFMSQYPIHRICHQDDAILVEGKSDEDWIYLSGENPASLDRLLQTHLGVEDRFFAVIEDWMLPHLLKHGEIDWILSCHKYVLPASTAMTPPVDLHIRELTLADATYIYNHYDYQQYTSIPYIKELIQKSFAYGIEDKGSLVAWIMTHDDGAIGLLHVLTTHRGKGYAKALVNQLANQLRQNNALPFMHIEEDNIASITVAKKCGFKLLCPIHWVKLK